MDRTAAIVVFTHLGWDCFSGASRYYNFNFETTDIPYQGPDKFSHCQAGGFSYFRFHCSHQLCKSWLWRPQSRPRWKSQPNAQESTRESESREHATTAASESTDAMAPTQPARDALPSTNHAITASMTRSVGCRPDTCTLLSFFGPSSSPSCPTARAWSRVSCQISG